MTSRLSSPSSCSNGCCTAASNPLFVFWLSRAMVKWTQIVISPHCLTLVTKWSICIALQDGLSARHPCTKWDVCPFWLASLCKMLQGECAFNHWFPAAYKHVSPGGCNTANNRADSKQCLRPALIYKVYISKLSSWHIEMQRDNRRDTFLHVLQLPMPRKTLGMCFSDSITLCLSTTWGNCSISGMIKHKLSTRIFLASLIYSIIFSPQAVFVSFHLFLKPAFHLHFALRDYKQPAHLKRLIKGLKLEWQPQVNGSLGTWRSGEEKGTDVLETAETVLHRWSDEADLQDRRCRIWQLLWFL